MATAVSRRGLFSRSAARLIPGDRDLAALGAAWRNFRDAEAGVERTDYRSLKEGARAAWAEGDEGAARRVAPVAELLVEHAAVAREAAVLDVGAGDGNVALAAAAREAAVTAIDLSPAMVTRGRARCEEAGTGVRWVVGDLEAMPFAGATFDCVLSSFGAMYAPRARKTASELVRVTRPGGLVAMTSWSSTAFMGRVLELAARLDPPPRGVTRPARWGRFEGPYLWLGSVLEEFEVVERELSLEFESPQAAARALVEEPGPLRAAVDGRTEEERRDALAAVVALVDRFGDASAADGVRIAVPYLVISGHRSPLLPAEE